ncbi:MAG: DUF3987 domain-containing protein [Filimonas sp.]|nr:DUF3987 domain-containing protein [Filimonas sp.]
MTINFFSAGITNITPQSQISIDEVFNLIKADEELKRKTAYLRKALPALQSLYKKNQLPYVTFGGTFKTRKDGDLVQESGLICLDIDGLNNAQDFKKKVLETAEQILVMAFISPRGNGLKLIFPCNPQFSFKRNFDAYVDYLINDIGLPENAIDKSCSNISRACFLCHDADVYYNPTLYDIQSNSYYTFLADKYFENVKRLSATSANNEIGKNEAHILFEKGYQYLSSRLNYEKRNDPSNFVSLCRLATRDAGDFKVGNRHNWLVKLAVYCNSFGITKEKAIQHFKTFFWNSEAVICEANPFDEKNDLYRVFDGMYEKNQEVFSSWTDKTENWKTPVIPDMAYQNLPPFIKGIMSLYDDARERDMFLLGTLTLLSTCFPRVFGVYDSRRIHANLFSFITAPAASGKGVLNGIKELGGEIHKRFLDDYQYEKGAYDALEEDGKKGIIPPVMKKFFVPANNTSAKLMNTIEGNKKMGLVFDTEADTLTNANKSEHGNFSEIYRKAFHHEDISYERKTNDEYCCINSSAFSVLVSGTPNQVRRMLPGSENGLTSRFLFYSFSSECIWKDVFAKKESCDYKLRSEGVRLFDITKPYLFDFLNGAESDEIEFSLSEQQGKEFNDWFREKSISLKNIYGDDVLASIRRMGTIFFRIAMILTTIRIAENEILPSQIVCSDIDFRTTTGMIDCLIYHSVEIYSTLKATKTGRASNKEKYIQSLPSQFNRKDAMDIANLMQIPEKTAESYLTQAVNAEMLSKPKHNEYKKVA